MNLIDDLFASQGDVEERHSGEPPDVKRPGAVFFAINPDAVAAARTESIARHLRGQHGLVGVPLAKDRFHVTLLLLGYYPELSEKTVALAAKAAAAVGESMRPFDIALDRAQSFPNGQTKLPLVLEGTDTIAGPTILRRALMLEMKRIGCPFSLKAGQTPHMTLLYDCSNVLEQAVEPVRWTVSDFVLIHSHHRHSRHVPLGRWQLQG